MVASHDVLTTIREALQQHRAATQPGWNISEKGSRILLSTEVPNLIRENSGRDADAFLADNGAPEERPQLASKQSPDARPHAA